jgi:hypothetical protein
MTSIGTPAQIAVTIARSAFSAVPLVGGALNEIFFDHRSRIKQGRFEELVAGLEADLGRLDAEAIREGYLQTEEFSDLLESLVLRVIRTGDPAKRARLRHVLVSQMQAPSPASDQELFLDVVAEITEKELEILRAYGEAYDRPRTDAEPIEQPKQGVFREGWSYGLDEPEYRFHVQKLIARGLLYDDGVGRWSTGAMQLFEISDLGRAFLGYLATGAG